ncbi:peroxiredoxin family protein [Rhizobium leguminosarum]|uniref:peroxiredoxin family protein n=1 Tax=Rhizobium leguminosarum TaxID=384 RepID=UPI0013D9B2A5|nr:redoxin domain-containing protein [Rhizobium leguminosarum]NEK38370.1 redoxin domain-containing protein [Rhizobium leguminosarum]
MTSGLGIGSPAPSIEVQDWLRGDPLSNFQLGKIYIPTFFSITCSGCGPALARLVQLQEEYGDIGIEVIGIAASGQASTADEALVTWNQSKLHFVRLLSQEQEFDRWLAGRRTSSF